MSRASCADVSSTVLISVLYSLYIMLNVKLTEICLWEMLIYEVFTLLLPFTAFLTSLPCRLPYIPCRSSYIH